MNDDTVPQFGASLSPPDVGTRRATSCPTCGSYFSPDGRFCPFDGTALVAAEGWDPSADALLGSVIDGRYEVLSVIGEGGMGTVYEVRHRALGKRFALKALRKDLALDGEIAARFIQEARTAAAVSHPGLVEITDFGRLASGQVYFVMELLEGQSLAVLLRLGGPLPAARGLDIVRQLVVAVKAAHDSSIVHRDLKPDNIHIGRGDGERDLVKVVDFGLAKVIGSSKLTRSGMVFGTPHYMSPEQAAGEVVDHRADIYALGIVMYEMFTGQVPFEADSYMGVLTKHMYMAPAPPSELSPELKQLGVLEELILRCLQKRPAARYDDLGALLADLDRCVPTGSSAGGVRSRARAAGSVSVLADELELPSRTEPRRRAGRGYWPLLVVGLAFVSGIALVVALRRPPATRGNVAAPTASPATPALHSNPPASSLGSLPTGLVSSSAASASSTARAPARKPTRVLQRPAAASAPSQKRAAGSSDQRRLGGELGTGQHKAGEIVDPWAR